MEANISNTITQMAASFSPTRPRADDTDAAIFRTITKRQFDLTFLGISMKYSVYQFRTVQFQVWRHGHVVLRNKW